MTRKKETTKAAVDSFHSPFAEENSIENTDKENIPGCEECITIPKERYRELLDYESIALWVLNSIVVSSLPNIDLTKDKLKELSNTEKYKKLQSIIDTIEKNK